MNLSKPSKYMRTTERQLQQSNRKITYSANTNGFGISKSKIQCVHFCQLWKMHNDPRIKLEDKQIPLVDKYKFLGAIFDRKLTFIPHIKYLKNKSTRVQQLLRVVAHTESRADRQMLRKLYRSLIHSKLDYAIFINRSARRSNLKQLISKHHEGLRQVLGTFRTSPVDSLYAETHEAHLQLKCEKLTLHYYTKLKSSPCNPIYDCILNPKYEQHFEKEEKSIKSFGLRMKSTHKESNKWYTWKHPTPRYHLLSLNPEVIFELNELPKIKTHPCT